MRFERCIDADLFPGGLWQDLKIKSRHKRHAQAHTKFMSLREMVNENNAIWLEIAVFVLGGCAYGLMEILYRGYTHWTMLVTGGACVLTLFYLREWLLAQPLILGALAGAVIITIYELSVGILVNLKLGWQVWDYSAQPGNVLGQICPAFTAIWFVVCLLFLTGVRLLLHA